jgi:hypothetical protein
LFFGSDEDDDKEGEKLYGFLDIPSAPEEFF